MKTKNKCTFQIIKFLVKANIVQINNRYAAIKPKISSYN